MRYDLYNRKSAYIFPNPHIEFEFPLTVCVFSMRSHADVRLSMRINRNAYALVKKIDMASSSQNPDVQSAFFKPKGYKETE